MANRPKTTLSWRMFFFCDEFQQQRDTRCSKTWRGCLLYTSPPTRYLMKTPLLASRCPSFSFSLFSRNAAASSARFAVFKAIYTHTHASCMLRPGRMTIERKRDNWLQLSTPKTNRAFFFYFILIYYYFARTKIVWLSNPINRRLRNIVSFIKTCFQNWWCLEWIYIFIFRLYLSDQSFT